MKALQADLQAQGHVIQHIKMRIQQQVQEDDKFSDLSLSEIKIERLYSQLNTLLQNLTHLQVLYLVDCSLSSLEGFPKMNLVAIDLSRNLIGDNSHLQDLTNCSKLEQVIIARNNICLKETILKVSLLNRLVEIDFSDNPISKDNSIRDKIFDLNPNIETINRRDKFGKQEILQDEMSQDQFSSQQLSVEDDEDIQQQQNEEGYESQSSGSKEKQKKSKKKKNHSQNPSNGEN